MDRIQCVSLPRSGHNLLVAHLQEYFGSQTVCPPIKKARGPFANARRNRQASPTGPDPHFHYCEYYYACRSSPCVDSGNHFQKSHDFDLLLPVHQNNKYIIQKRNPIDLLISWFEMRLLKRREIDSAEGFVAFCNRNKPYLDGFNEKWVDAIIQQRLIIDYDFYLDATVESLTTIIQFFDEAANIAVKRLAEIVANVRPAKNNRNFRYYDAAMSNCDFSQNLITHP